MCGMRYWRIILNKANNIAAILAVYYCFGRGRTVHYTWTKVCPGLTAIRRPICYNLGQFYADEVADKLAASIEKYVGSRNKLVL